ncbi:MAG: sugar phosphate nucleotidyltransferase [bacterium]|nr:sugar phosphate nucleotidyltransferase [bacterium]
MTMVDNAYCVIMVGGPGERLWPASTKKRPKPFLSLTGNIPLIKEVTERIKPLFPNERILFILQEEHKRLAGELFPEFTERNYIIEPEPKDTAAAIGLASLYLPSGSTMVVLSGDHWIPDEDRFKEAVSAGTKFIEENPDLLLLFGIKPTRPETGYGYLEAGDLLAEIDGIRIRRVKGFSEKPNKEKARLYIADQKYFWNSGMFIWKKERMQGLLAKFMPELFEGLCQIKNGKEKEVVFKELKKVSIDYGLLEKTSSVAMIEAGFCWDDVGTWESLLRVHQTDEKGNLIIGEVKASDTSKCIIYSENGQVVAVGVSDLVIAQVGNKVLIAGKDRLDKIKQLLIEFFPPQP